MSCSASAWRIGSIVGRKLVGGGLTNDGTIQIGPDNDSLSAATTVSATSITNFVTTTFGTIDVYGNDSSDLPAPIPAALDISGAAGFGVANTVEGDVNIAYDGRIVFASGQITTIAGHSVRLEVPRKS